MDIKNSYCVAEYIACLKRFDMLQTVLFWQKRHKAFFLAPYFKAYENFYEFAR